MSANGTKLLKPIFSRMTEMDLQFWTGVVLLVGAGVLLFTPTTFGGFAYELAAVAVLGLAGGAFLIGTSEGERPV